MKQLVLVVAACAHTATVPPPLVAGDRTLDVRGAKIAVHVRGAGPVCLVLPGGPSLEWTYLRMPEVEKAAMLVYIAPAGTGGSTRAPARELNRTRWADDVEGVRAALGLDRPCIIGHSYGGFVAQTFAIAHPDHVGALVLYDTAARNDDEFGKAIVATVEAQYKNEPWFADAMAAGDAEATATTDDEMTELFHREAPMMFADYTARFGEFAQLVASVHAYAPSGGGGPPLDARAALAKLHVPALVIVGRHDAITSPRFADELHAALPGSRLVVLEHSGHMGHLEEPAEFARAVVEFVTALPRPPSSP
jgi:proline iminopeptidase